MEQKKGNSWNVVVWVIHGWAATIYPFMRKNIGRRHPGIAGLIGMGWVILWVSYTRAGGLLWLIPLYIAGQVLHLIGCARKPSEVHSHYYGDPVLAMTLGFKDPRAARRFGEPLIAFAVGMGLILYGYQEGKYFVFGAVALIVNQSLIDMQERRRVDDMRDGMIEGRYFLGRARERRA